MRQMGGQDASFIYNEAPRVPQHIGGIAIYDPSTAPGGKVTFKGILEHIQSRMALVPSQRERMVRVPFDLGHPWWVVDAEFDLEFHIRHIALPRPGDWRQLCIQAARLHARELDLDRPLWEMYVIEGLDNVDGVPPGSFAVVSKTHHAAIDGMSGAELSSVIHDTTPDAERLAPAVMPPGEPVPAPQELLLRALISNAMRPQRYAAFMRRVMPQLQQIQGLTRQRPAATPTAAPRTRFSGAVSAHRVVDGRTFTLDEVKRIRTAVPGATINDAVLAVVAGAMRHYLQSKGELPAERLVVMAPMSIRSEADKGALGNRVSGMLVPIPTDLADPVERLHVVHDATVASKEAANAIPADVLTDMNEFMPFAFVGLASRTAARLRLADRSAPAVNTVVTNVPGPQQPLYLAGAQLLHQYGLGLVGDGTGLFHTVLSYNGELSISATACREMLPDPDFYAECLQSSFDELAEASGARDRAPKSRTARVR